jgi:HK97 family phage prohead protease
MPNELLDDIQFKARNGAQISVDSAQGIVECFVSGIGNKDSVGDIVLPGAFNESLKRRKPRVVWGHSWNDPIGKVLEIYEVSNADPRLPPKMKTAGIGGLFAKVQFNLAAEKGREAFANVAFFGEEQEWSIGYKTLQATFDPVKQANLLKEVELYEVSPVLHGANQLTGTISVKDGEYGACGTDGCECGTKSHIASEPDIQVEAEEAFIFEKGQMMGRVPMQMIIIPMPKKPDSDPHDADSDIWARGEAGPIDMEARMGLAREIHGRTKVPIKIIEATENMVVFLRKMVDGTTRMYRMPYHKTDSGQYTFGKPARVKPQTVYTPVQPNMPPVGPMSHKPNHYVSPIQGKETIEEAKSDYLISCTLDNIFEFKDTLQPIFDYYEVTVTPSVSGLLCSDYPSGFEDAADTAIKALGGRLGRGGGLGKGRRAGRALAATFDPKAWDGDGDGIVQEGTPFQRPSIPGINTNWPGDPKTRVKPDDYPDDSAQVRDARKPRRDPNRMRPGKGPARRRGVIDARWAAGLRSISPSKAVNASLDKTYQELVDEGLFKYPTKPHVAGKPIAVAHGAPDLAKLEEIVEKGWRREGGYEQRRIYFFPEGHESYMDWEGDYAWAPEDPVVDAGVTAQVTPKKPITIFHEDTHGSVNAQIAKQLGISESELKSTLMEQSELVPGTSEVADTARAAKPAWPDDHRSPLSLHRAFGVDLFADYTDNKNDGGNGHTLRGNMGSEIIVMDKDIIEVVGVRQTGWNEDQMVFHGGRRLYRSRNWEQGRDREVLDEDKFQEWRSRTNELASSGMRSRSGGSSGDWEDLKSQLPSQAIRNMSVKERKGRLADLDKKIDVLEHDMDEMGSLDPEYNEMKQRLSQLDSERTKHLISAAIDNWEGGQKSFVRLPVDSKGVELELTQDEIDSLRSHIKALIGKSKNNKVNGILAKYDQRLVGNKDGVVKIPKEQFSDLIKAWDQISPPAQSRMHPKTGRDILEFAALSPTQKFRSSQLDLPDNKYRGFGDKRINNGAHPDITPANQAKMMEAIGAPEGERRGLYLPGHDYLMFADLKEHGSGSPRRWAIMEGQFIHDTQQGRSRADLPQLPGEPLVETLRGARRANMGGPNMGRGGRTRRQSRSGPQSLRAMPGDVDALFDEPGVPDVSPDIDVTPENKPVDTAALRRLTDRRYGPPLTAAQARERRVERLARRSDSVNRRRSNDLLSRWDEAASGTSRDPMRRGLRSEQKIPQRATADQAKPETRGRPMGHVVEDSQKRFKGKKFEEIKPSDWDDLSTEDKFALLSAELTPKKSGIRQIDYDRIYNELDKIIEKRELRRGRSEGRFETMAERRARRGGVVLSPNVRKRESEDREPKRTTAQAAKTERKKVLNHLESSFANADSRATGGGDAVRSEHADIWSEALDIVSESDDLTHSQLRALDGLFDSYLSRESGDLSPVEGELRAAALSRKSHIEDLLSDYESDRFISEGNTPEVRTLGGGGDDLDIMEVNNLELFSSGGMRSIRQNRSKLPGTSTQEYVDARRRQGLRSQAHTSREEKIGDLRNLWSNARATGDKEEMDRLERQLRELGAKPSRGNPRPQYSAPSRRLNQNNETSTGNRGMRSEREGRAQIAGEATWFKKIEDSLQKEIDMASRDKDKQTADALRTLKQTLARQESGKTGDKRTNAGTLTVTQAEIDTMLDALMHVLDRQTAEKGSRTAMFAELIEKLSSAAISTFILRETEEIQSRTRRATNEAGRGVNIPNTDL